MTDREPLPAALVAARETALARAGAALADALSRAQAARQALDAEKAALAAAHLELHGLADGGIDETAIEAALKRREILSAKVRNYAPRIAAADGEVEARGAEIDDARQA